jgi:hypothetical protein
MMVAVNVCSHKLLLIFEVTSNGYPSSSKVSIHFTSLCYLQAKGPNVVVDNVGNIWQLLTFKMSSIYRVDQFFSAHAVTTWWEKRLQFVVVLVLDRVEGRMGQFFCACPNYEFGCRYLT